MPENTTADTSDVVMVWNKATGDLRTVDPETGLSFTEETAATYAAQYGAAIMVSRNGSPFARIVTRQYQRPGLLARVRRDTVAVLARLGIVRGLVLLAVLAAAAVPAALMAVSAPRPLNVGMYRGTDHGMQVCVHVVHHLGFGAPECKAWADAD